MNVFVSTHEQRTYTSIFNDHLLTFKSIHIVRPTL